MEYWGYWKIFLRLQNTAPKSCIHSAQPMLSNTELPWSIEQDGRQWAQHKESLWACWITDSFGLSWWAGPCRLLVEKQFLVFIIMRKPSQTKWTIWHFLIPQVIFLDVFSRAKNKNNKIIFFLFFFFFFTETCSLFLWFCNVSLWKDILKVILKVYSESYSERRKGALQREEAPGPVQCALPLASTTCFCMEGIILSSLFCKPAVGLFSTSCWALFQKSPRQTPLRQTNTVFCGIFWQIKALHKYRLVNLGWNAMY